MAKRNLLAATEILTRLDWSNRSYRRSMKIRVGVVTRIFIPNDKRTKALWNVTWRGLKTEFLKSFFCHSSGICVIFFVSICACFYIYICKKLKSNSFTF